MIIHLMTVLEQLNCIFGLRFGVSDKTLSAEYVEYYTEMLLDYYFIYFIVMITVTRMLF